MYAIVHCSNNSKNFLTEINYLYHKVLQLLQGIKNKGEDSNEGIIRNEI